MESAAEQEVQELPRRVSLNSSCSKKSLCGTFPEDVTPQRKKHFGHLVLTSSGVCRATRTRGRGRLQSLFLIHRAA